MHGLLLIPAVLMASVLGTTTPESGSWKGHETSKARAEVSFRVQGSKVVGFHTHGTVRWTCGHRAKRTKVPTLTTATVRWRKGSYRFTGGRTLPLAGARTRVSIAGSFSTERLASGTLVVTRSGCRTRRSRWTADGPAPKTRVPGTGDGELQEEDNCGPECESDDWLDMPNVPQVLDPHPVERGPLLYRSTPWFW